MSKLINYFSLFPGNPHRNIRIIIQVKYINFRRNISFYYMYYIILTFQAISHGFSAGIRLM